MVNQYGQTDLTQALLAQGTSPSPYKTGLGQAARLGGIALAEWGKRKKAEQSRSALADALAGLNGGALTGEGPTTDAAGRAPIGDPQLLARLLSDPNTAGVGQALLGRALQPAPERKVIKGADGYNYYQGTGERVLPNVQQQPKQPNPTAAMQEYGMAKEQGYPGSFQQYQIDMKRAGASKTTVNNNLDLSKGQEKADKDAATEYNEFILQGGAADMQKNIGQLEEVAKSLEQSDNLTGALIGVQPMWLRTALNPESVDTQQAVEEVVQRNLRLVLGAQFTAEEGNRLIARAYNPSLDESVNAKRIRRLLGSIKKAYSAKLSAAQYFEKNGTLKGHEGVKQYTINDIERDARLDDVDKSETPDEPEAGAAPIDYGAASIEQLRALDANAMKNMTDDELAAAARRWEELNGAQ